MTIGQEETHKQRDVFDGCDVTSARVQSSSYGTYMQILNNYINYPARQCLMNES